ncbi:MAG: hypothetical protein B9S34_16055 [Opitutia bacterium Tous-C1TDCM]|nr:MAG: hypothetical protein B9S34_16055 [Opitutae bacterium Tous-C1TDCM]
MTTPATPPVPPPAGDDRNLVPVDAANAISFDEKLQLFWAKYRSAVMGFCALVLVAIVGKGGWEYMERQKERDIEQAYAAATTSEQLKAFISSHSGHSLAGIAHVRLADEAYAATKSADAIAGYEKAVALLKGSPLGARAQLGLALAKIKGGKAAEGVNDLKQLAGETAQFKAIRTEAAYHLTSLAVEAGNAADAQKFSDQLMQIDPASPWTQRGMALRATLPAAPVEAKPAEAAPAGGVKLPGK